MLLALATCADLPAHEFDDRRLHRELSARGLRFEQPIWNAEAVDWARYAGVLIRTTWDYHVAVGAYCAWAERVAAVTRLWNPPAVVHWNTHKRYLRDLERDGIRVVPTIWLDRGSAPDVRQLVRGLGSASGFLKPCVGATSRETLSFGCDDAGLATAAAHVARLIGGEDLMLQPFLDSVTERGEWSAIFVDGELTHCVRKIPAPGDYRVQDDFGARDEPYHPTLRERQAAEQVMALAAARFGEELLYGRTDWLWDSDGNSCLTELELVEPSLFFRHDRAAVVRLVDAWLERL